MRFAARLNQELRGVDAFLTQDAADVIAGIIIANASDDLGASAQTRGGDQGDGRQATGLPIIVDRRHVFVPLGQARHGHKMVDRADADADDIGAGRHGEPFVNSELRSRRWVHVLPPRAQRAQS